MAEDAHQRGAGIRHLQEEALLPVGVRLQDAALHPVEEVPHPTEEVLHQTEEALHLMEEVPPAAVAVLHAKDFIYK